MQFAFFSLLYFYVLWRDLQVPIFLQGEIQKIAGRLTWTCNGMALINLQCDLYWLVSDRHTGDIALENCPHPRELRWDQLSQVLLGSGQARKDLMYSINHCLLHQRPAACPENGRARDPIHPDAILSCEPPPYIWTPFESKGRNSNIFPKE